MALPLITDEQRYRQTRGGSATDRLPVLAVDFNPLVTVVNDLIDGTTSLTEVEVGNGTAAAPSVSFTSDPDTGLYRVGANDIGIATAGTLAVDVSATAVTSALPVLNAAGTVSAPAVSFSADSDTGIYRIGANNLGIAANGAKVLDVATTGLGVTGGVSATGAATLKSATAVPATAGAVAAGAAAVLYSTSITVEVTSDVPTHTRPKGSICINTGGSSTSTRMYVNTDGAGTWASFTTSA